MATAEAGTVIDATNLEVKLVEISNGNNARPTATLKEGVTVKGLTVLFDGANQNILTDGAVANSGAITFDGCTFKAINDFSNKTYLQSGANAGNTKVVFNDCTFTGPAIFADATGGGVEYNNCKFELSDGYGYVQCMGGDHIFNNCTFDISGSYTYFDTAITKFGKLNLYSERYNTNVVLNGCNSVSRHIYNALGGAGSVTVK